MPQIDTDLLALLEERGFVHQSTAADGLRAVASGLSAKAGPNIRIRPGAVVRIVRNSRNQWAMTQIPPAAALDRRRHHAHR